MYLYIVLIILYNYILYNVESVFVVLYFKWSRLKNIWLFKICICIYCMYLNFIVKDLYVLILFLDLFVLNWFLEIKFILNMKKRYKRLKGFCYSNKF